MKKRRESCHSLAAKVTNRSCSGKKAETAAASCSTAHGLRMFVEVYEKICAMKLFAQRLANKIIDMFVFGFYEINTELISYCTEYRSAINSIVCVCIYFQSDHISTYHK